MFNLKPGIVKRDHDIIVKARRLLLHNKFGFNRRCAPQSFIECIREAGAESSEHAIDLLFMNL